MNGAHWAAVYLVADTDGVDDVQRKERKPTRQKHTCAIYHRKIGSTCLYSLLTSNRDAHCCHIHTAIKHPVHADRVKPSFVIFDIWAL